VADAMIEAHSRIQELLEEVHMIGHGSEQALVTPAAHTPHKPVEPLGNLVLCLAHVLTPGYSTIKSLEKMTPCSRVMRAVLVIGIGVGVSRFRQVLNLFEHLCPLILSMYTRRSPRGEQS
jgi:hypothetical protein